MTRIHANIGVGHENDWAVLEKRIISAAQCNADAVVLSKSTPHLVIPDDKKYVSIPSKWGHLPYIDVAKRSELDEENISKVNSLCKQIGIPLIMSVTDSTSAEFVREHTDITTIKIHHMATDLYDLIRYAKQTFQHTYVDAIHLEHIHGIFNMPADRNILTVYITTDDFPPVIEDLQYGRIDELLLKNYKVGYEGKEAGIFPVAALAYTKVEWIEKYLGDEGDETNPSILTPQQFYDLFNTVHIMEQAWGSTGK